ncbi:hypothetical protein SAMN04488121_107111 [Chitinophaga filiformis]|uniref:Uncharacterized protein n=2 Tax=Chitinophaga filiformis TaxID=104663 RepID=A0A1G7XWC6_CHIFI|nr:hypothetical protein SAMN04488121_107111 [Chitinophaga filiformis]
MVKTEKQIFRRFLLYIMLIAGLMTGQSSILLARSPLKAGKTVCVERLFDHEKIHIPYIDNGGSVEEENELQLVLATKKVPRKKRYYINSTYQSSSYTTRFLQFQYNHEFYIPVRENKTGVYTQQHAFLPAYYSFLSRYTPF